MGSGFQDQLNFHTGRNATFDYVSLTKQRSLTLPLPTIQTQKAIAHILGTLDDKIELNRQTNKTLEAIAKAIFKSWFVDFDPVHYKQGSTQQNRKSLNAAADEKGASTPNDDPTDAARYSLSPEILDLFPDSFQDSELGEIPAGWEASTLESLCIKVESGGTPRRGNDEYWNPAKIRWLTSGEVRQDIIIETENYISELGLKESSAKLWEPWTTVVAMYGATAGESTLLSVETSANQACCALIPAEFHEVFNYLVVRTAGTRLGDQARGSAQQNLNKGLVANYPAIKAPTEIMKEFNASTKPMIHKCIQNLNESKTLAALRDTLLPKLISGELPIKNAEKFLEQAGV